MAVDVVRGHHRRLLSSSTRHRHIINSQPLVVVVVIIIIICSRCHCRHHRHLLSLSSLSPSSLVVIVVVTIFSRWVDDHLVHVLSPNIYRTTSEALESFDYIAKTGNFSFSEKLTVKYAGAAIMYMISKKLKKKYNITDERAALYDAADTWTNALDGKDFLGGSKPNLADLAAFGVLRPIRYLRAGKDMVENMGIGLWYGRMEVVVGGSSRIEA